MTLEGAAILEVDEGNHECETEADAEKEARQERHSQLGQKARQEADRKEGRAEHPEKVKMKMNRQAA